MDAGRGAYSWLAGGGQAGSLGTELSGGLKADTRGPEVLEIGAKGASGAWPGMS